MAKKVKKSLSKAASKKLKSDAIKDYIQLRKTKEGHKISRDYFLRNAAISKRELSQLFGSFLEFKKVAEGEHIRKMPQAKRALLSERSKKFNVDASAEECIEDLRRVQLTDEARYITRNIYREEGQFSDTTWHQYYGNFSEFRKQAGLELTRHQQRLEKAAAKHASFDHYKRFYDEKVLPYHNKYVKESKNRHNAIRTIMVISDIHDIEADGFTLAVFIDTCKKKQPDIIVLNGDIFDLYEFSRYTKDPRNYKPIERFEYVWGFFKKLRKVCPDAQIDFIMGNHEFRLIKLLADVTPNVRILLADILGLEFQDIFKLDEFEINWVSRANLSAFTKKDINDELKKNYQIYYDCYVVCHEPDKNLMVMSGTNGHHHRVSLVSNAYPDPLTNLPKSVTWVQTPAAHVRDAEYLQNMSKWNTGFLEVTVNIEKKEVIQKTVQTHDWTVIDGVYYERSSFEDE